jgi:hypothetical protein
MLTHQGFYGEGNPQLIDYKILINNMTTRFIDNPLFSIILTIAVILLIQKAILLKKNKKMFPKEFSLLISVILAQIFGVLMCATRPPTNTNHYLLPFLCLSGITLYLILFFISEIIQFYNMENFKTKIFIWVGVLLFSCFTIILNIKNAYDYFNRSQKNATSINQKIPNYSNFCQVQYSGANSIYAALRGGNLYSGFEHSKCLEKIYGRILFFNLNGYLTDWENRNVYSFERLLKDRDKIFFYGACFDLLEDLGLLSSNFFISKNKNTVIISTLPNGLMIELQRDCHNELGQCIYVLKAYNPPATDRLNGFHQ